MRSTSHTEVSSDQTRSSHTFACSKTFPDHAIQLHDTQVFARRYKSRSILSGHLDVGRVVLCFALFTLLVVFCRCVFTVITYLMQLIPQQSDTFPLGPAETRAGEETWGHRLRHHPAPPEYHQDHY